MIYRILLPTIPSFLFLVGVFFVLLLCKPRTRMYSFIVVALAFPYLFYIIPFGNTIINSRDAVLYVHAFAICLAFLRRSNFQYSKLDKRAKIFLFVLAGALLFSTYIHILKMVLAGSSFELVTSRLRFGALHSFLWLIGFVGAYLFISRKEDVRLLMKIIFIVAFIVALDGLFGHVFGFWRVIAEGQSGVAGRLGTITAGGYDNTGRVLAMGIIAALYLIYTVKQKRMSAIIFIVISLFVSTFTLTRGVYVAMALALFLMLTLMPKNKRFPIFVLIGFIILLVFILGMFSQIENLVIKGRGVSVLDPGTMKGRINFWSSFFIPVFIDYFPFGTGFGYAQSIVFSEGYSATYWGPSSTKLITLHSMPLELILENGIGGILVLALIIWILWSTFAFILKHRCHETVQEIKAVWTVIVILFVTMTIITAGYLGYVMMAFFGVLFALRSQLDENKEGK